MELGATNNNSGPDEHEKNTRPTKIIRLEEEERSFENLSLSGSSEGDDANDGKLLANLQFQLFLVLYPYMSLAKKLWERVRA